MSAKKRVRQEVKETVDEATRIMDKGIDKAAEVLKRGVSKVEEGARAGGKLMPPLPPRRRASAGDVFDDTAMFVGRAGKKALDVADRGVKKAGELIAKDPDLKHAMDRGVAAVDKVTEKGIELTKKGLKKTEEVIRKHTE